MGTTSAPIPEGNSSFSLKYHLHTAAGGGGSGGPTVKEIEWKADGSVPDIDLVSAVDDQVWMQRQQGVYEGDGIPDGGGPPYSPAFVPYDPLVPPWTGGAHNGPTNYVILDKGHNSSHQLIAWRSESKLHMAILTATPYYSGLQGIALGTWSVFHYGSNSGGGSSSSGSWSSGWEQSHGGVAVANGSTHTITHNLGAADILFEVFVNSSASDVDAQRVTDWATATSLTANTIVLQLKSNGYSDWDSNGDMTSGHDFAGKFLKVVVMSGGGSSSSSSLGAYDSIEFINVSGSAGHKTLSVPGLNSNSKVALLSLPVGHDSTESAAQRCPLTAHWDTGNGSNTAAEDKGADLVWQAESPNDEAYWNTGHPYQGFKYTIVTGGTNDNINLRCGFTDDELWMYNASSGSGSREGKYFFMVWLNGSGSGGGAPRIYRSPAIVQGGVTCSIDAGQDDLVLIIRDGDKIGGPGIEGVDPTDNSNPSVDQGGGQLDPHIVVPFNTEGTIIPWSGYTLSTYVVLDIGHNTNPTYQLVAWRTDNKIHFSQSRGSGDVQRQTGTYQGVYLDQSYYIIVYPSGASNQLTNEL